MMCSSVVCVRVSDFVSEDEGRLFCSLRIIMRSRSSLVMWSDLFPCVLSLSTFCFSFFVLAMHLVVSVCMVVILGVLVTEEVGVGSVSIFLRVTNIW